MSGYSPSVLELAAVPGPAPLTHLQRHLEQKFALVQPRDISHRYKGTRIVGNISVGEIRVGVEASLRRDIATASECLAIELESSAYDASYDLLLGRVLPKGRKALIHFCVGVAVEMKAVGFRLRRDENQWPVLSLDVLREAIAPSGEAGILLGVSVSSDLAQDMKRYWARTVEELHSYLLLGSL